MKLVVGSAHWSSCSVTSAQNSFDFKRYSPNLHMDALLYTYYSALHLIGCCDSYNLAVTYLICLLVFMGLPYMAKRKSLAVIRTTSLGSHKGSSGFCKSLQFPLQKPLPASNQLPSIKGGRKGAVKGWLWLWVKMVICSISENVLTGVIKASCHSLVTESKHVTKMQPLYLQQNCNAWLTLLNWIVVCLACIQIIKFTLGCGLDPSDWKECMTHSEGRIWIWSSRLPWPCLQSWNTVACLLSGGWIQRYFPSCIILWFRAVS